MMELSPLIHPRSSPVVLAIAREMMHIQQSETPDGAPAVPYLVFLVRPDGIRLYYQARSRLEPLGIAFGYELVEQDLAIDIPNFDDVRTWDGTKPLDIAGGDSKPRGGWPARRQELGGRRTTIVAGRVHRTGHLAALGRLAAETRLRSAMARPGPRRRIGRRHGGRVRLIRRWIG